MWTLGGHALKLQVNFPVTLELCGCNTTSCACVGNRSQIISWMSAMWDQQCGINCLFTVYLSSV